jgi:hypothetical protein
LAKHSSRWSPIEQHHKVEEKEKEKKEKQPAAPSQYLITLSVKMTIKEKRPFKKEPGTLKEKDQQLFF